MTAPSIRAAVTVRQILTPRTCRGTLPNGRAILVFVPRTVAPPQINTGDVIIARLSPADFSTGEFVENCEPAAK